MKKIDLAGQRFGRLLVISPNYSKKRTAWNCLCDCGNNVVTTTDSLRTKKTISCGCYKRERARDANIKHNKRKTRLYTIFANMKQRCYNKSDSKYKNYGKRGIIICNEWLGDFNRFYNWAMANGYADDLTVDRIDVNGNYEPNNCRWIPANEQCKNKTTNRLITFNGKTKILSEWCKELNLKYKLVYRRIKDGWSIKDAFFKPLCKEIYYEYNGQLLTRYDIAKLKGVNYKIIKSKFDNKWTIDKIMVSSKEELEKKKGGLKCKTKKQLNMIGC